MREFCALEDVQQSPLRVVANGIATLCNLQMYKGEPFTAEDFLGTGNRKAREEERMLMDIAVRRENARLQQMKAGDPPPEDLPEWARMN